MRLISGSVSRSDVACYVAAKTDGFVKGQTDSQSLIAECRPFDSVPVRNKINFSIQDWVFDIHYSREYPISNAEFRIMKFGG